MEILGQFGFDPRLFIAQIINFLILVFIFKRFLYKPILKQIKDRENKIKKGLTDADAAEKALAHAEARQDEIIKKAGLEAEKILENAKQSASEIRENTIIRTREEADKIVQSGKEQALLQLENVKHEAARIALTISESILTRALGDMFTESEKKSIIARSIKDLRKYENTRS